MKKTRKIIAFILSMIMIISMTSITAVAEGLDSNANSDGTTTGNSLSGGPCAAKTGFYVTVSKGPSDGSVSHAIGHGALLQAQGGRTIPKFDVDTESKISGSSMGLYNIAPWPYPAFRGGSNAYGFGTTIINWCKQQGDDGFARAYAIAKKYCGVTPEEIADLIADGQQVYLNIEPVMFCNYYGSTKASKGPIITGLVSGIAKKIPEGKTYISSITKAGFPKSFMYEPNKNWQGIRGISPVPSGLISNGDMQNKNLGYGICSLKFNAGLQVVIVCESSSGTCETEYLTTDKEWNITTMYKGCKFEEATFSKKKSPLTDPHATYGAVCSSGEPNRAVGVGNQVFNIPDGEEALFIHYKGDPIEPKLTETHLKSWETAYLNPRYAADRKDGHAVDNEYTLATHIQEEIDRISSKSMSCPRNGGYCEHVQCTGHVVIDKVTCRGSEDWQNQKYGVIANLGEYPHAIWNLYREEVSGEKWDVFGKALGNIDRWQINKPVDPQFSYFLTRSHLENVSVSPDREGVGAISAQYNISPKYDWKINYTGVEGVTQKANSESTHTVEDYAYRFTAYGYDLKIYYHFEHDAKDYEEREDQDDGNGGKISVITHECHHPAHAYNEAGGDWGGIGDSTIYAENEYTPETWVGSTGGHKEDKFKTKAMPSGKNTNAGKIVDEVRGEALVGKFVKGATFEYEPITDQLVGSEFQDTTFKIYPEVAMSIWLSSNAERYTNPTERLVYVMGEYARTYTPPIAHSYKTYIDTGKMRGIGSLASAATGSATDSINPYDLGVTAMGTTFEIATKSHYEMDIYTVGCNITENQAHEEWGNTPTDVRGSHEEYVNSILNGIKQEIIMKMDSTQFARPVYYTLLATESNLTRTDDNAETSVFWHMGNYDEAGTVQGWCNTMWGLGADAYEEALQYTPTKILDTMFVSCTDGTEDNASMTYNPDPHVGTAMGGVLAAHGAHWYDEESKEKMKVEYYHTHIVFGLQNADDKVDYNLLTQDYSSRLNKASDNIHVSFYTRLWMPLDFTTADGFIWPGHTGTFRVDKMYETDFSVVNQTTAQMKK